MRSMTTTTTAATAAFLALSLVLLVNASETNKTKVKRAPYDQLSQESINRYAVFANSYQFPGYSSVVFNSPSGSYASKQTFDPFLNQSPATTYGPDYYQTLLAQTGPIQCIQITKNCRAQKYRTFDGSCNNLRNPTLGAANTVLSRMAPAKYADGSYMPAVSVTGKPLPGARLVSVALFPDIKINDPQLTLAAMQWGQLMTHDMALAVGTTPSDQAAANCCTNDGRVVSAEGYTARYCMPIIIPDGDPFYTKYNQGCISFARTLTDQDVGCGSKAKPADQVVAVSQFLDASPVYGSNDDIAAGLRTFQGGKLIVDYRNGEVWPPMHPNTTIGCPVQNVRVPICYRAGDIRVNQNPQLTILQVLLLREHNRIAEKLQEINPHWDDEKVYQETRKIVVGQMQFISYYEWLPLFLGTENLINYGIIYDPKTNLYVDDYNEHVDARVMNEHTTGAFRAFHTNIQGYLKLVTEARQSSGSVRLSDHFHNPAFLEFGNIFNDLARGLVTQPQDSSDQYHTSEVTTFLFRDNQPFGFDLKAIDVQRGRDHGLPSYNTMRRYCGSKRAEHFEDFLDYMTAQSVQKLQTMYDHPEDVDLIVGGLLENLLPGTLSGPTFLCIMMEQFYRTRVGDRYFFENHQHEGAFTPEQLAEIKKSSLARLMCNTVNDLFSVQPKAFVRISDANPLLPCDDINSIPVIDLEAWKDFRGHGGGHRAYSAYFFKK